MGQPNFQAEMRQLLRDRALDAARDLACSDGWSAVNMSRIASEIGVSRPVLYKEIGTRQALGEALVSRETDMFLAGVVDCLAVNPDDPIEGIARAVEFTLQTAADNTLIKTILAGERGADSGLLPLLATQPAPVLIRAIDALSLSLRARYPLLHLDDAGLDELTEVVVRLTLSHMMQPRGPVAGAVAQARRVVTAILAAPA